MAALLVVMATAFIVGAGASEVADAVMRGDTTALGGVVGRQSQGEHAPGVRAAGGVRHTAAGG